MPPPLPPPVWAITCGKSQKYAVAFAVQVVSLEGVFAPSMSLDVFHLRSYSAPHLNMSYHKLLLLAVYAANGARSCNEEAGILLMMMTGWQ